MLSTKSGKNKPSEPLVPSAGALGALHKEWLLSGPMIRISTASAGTEYLEVIDSPGIITGN